MIKATFSNLLKHRVNDVIFGYSILIKSKIGLPISMAQRNFNVSTRNNLKVMIGSVPINYESSANAKRVALCLPGSLGSIETDFSIQMKSLPSSELQIIGWDPPGYGKSRPPLRKYSPTFFKDDAILAVKMMKELGHEKFSLLGWSDGGITALMMAIEYPENIDKMVVWGANSYIHKRDIELYEAIRDVNKWSDRMRLPMEQIYGKDYFKATWEQWIDAMTSIYDKNRGEICDDQLKSIQCPTLIIHGLKDAMVDENHAQNLHKKIANSRLVLWENGKHNLHMKYAEEFDKLVTQFLSKDN